MGTSEVEGKADQAEGVLGSWSKCEGKPWKVSSPRGQWRAILNVGSLLLPTSLLGHISLRRLVYQLT